jgi:single-strand DNA-binding protein
MNKVMLTGRLVKDPESKTTSSGKKVVSFSIAVNDGKSKEGTELVSYFNLNAWERLADVVESYAKKGTKVLVMGRLQNRSWDKPDGTKGYATDITVSELELLSSKSEMDNMGSGGGSNAGGYSQAPSAPKKDNSKQQDDDSLPEIDIEAINVQMPF